MSDIIIKSSYNQYLFDINNNKYIDLRMGAGTMVLGHNNDFMISILYNNKVK